jgi:tetratricopeptide (TPR) repeat protein
MGNPSPQTYASQREALLAPGDDAMQRRDYATALKDYRIVLAEYPNDSRVLMIAGNAAWASGDLEQAAEYFRRCLARPGGHPWGVRSASFK